MHTYMYTHRKFGYHGLKLQIILTTYQSFRRLLLLNCIYLNLNYTYCCTYNELSEYKSEEYQFYSESTLDCFGVLWIGMHNNCCLGEESHNLCSFLLLLPTLVPI